MREIGTFNFTEVMKIIPHAKRSTVQLWVRDGLITPQKMTKGRGTHREYSIQNIAQIIVATHLSSKYGMSPEGIKIFMKKGGL